jgi:hypothetical protein
LAIKEAQASAAPAATSVLPGIFASFVPMSLSS